MFEAVYGSIWHHPVAFWAAGLPVLLLLLRRRLQSGSQFALNALIVFQVAILLDAWLTSALSPLSEGTTAKTAAAVVFVVLGDLRFFVLVERYGRPAEQGRRLGRWLGIPLAMSLVIPAASQLVAASLSVRPRVHFLVYELMFVALAATLRFVVLPRRRDMRAPKWVARLTQFELVQYTLWASADVIILLGLDAGFLVRLVPNFMYYAVFVPFAWWTRPEELAP